MASLGTMGRLTACPRCRGGNAVVWAEDVYGSSGRCLYCGWQGYAERSAGVEGNGIDGRDREPRSRRVEREGEPAAMSS